MVALLHQAMRSASFGGGAAPASRTYNGLSADSSLSSTPSFASQPFGTETADRKVLCAVFWATNAAARTLSSATIGGVSATILSQTTFTTTVYYYGVAFIMADVPTGTTGTVALTLSGTAIAKVALYSVYGLTTGLVDFATNQQNNFDYTTRLDLQVDVQDGGLVFAARGGTDAQDNEVWYQITDDYEGGPVMVSGAGVNGASALVSATESNRTIGITPWPVSGVDDPIAYNVVSLR